MKWFKYYKLGKFIMENLNEIPEFESPHIKKEKLEHDEHTSLIYMGDVHTLTYVDKDTEHYFVRVI